MQPIIFHIDFDSFFASVEQQYNPILRNKPIGVTAANGRTCIIASSREAKLLGITTGTRTFDAQALYPSLALVSADFIKYWEISKKFIAICKDYSPYIEVFSIDELFMDVTQTVHLFGGVSRLIERIKKRIKKEIGEYITVSVGVSHNKLLAKLASGLQKPNGYMEIRKEDIERVYKNIQLTDICGIGQRIKARLHGIGVYTLEQLRTVPLSFLISEFGSAEASFLNRASYGIDTTSVTAYTTEQSVKSVSRNYCLPHNEYNQKVVLQNIFELCEEVGIKLRKLGKKARTIGLSLRGFHNLNGRKTYFSSLDCGRDIFLACKTLYDEWEKGKDQSSSMVRMISVWASHLENARSLPLSLFEDREKKDRLQKTIDSLNERFGDHTIRNGFLLYADKLTTVPNGYMADTLERHMLSISNLR